MTTARPVRRPTRASHELIAPVLSQVAAWDRVGYWREAADLLAAARPASEHDAGTEAQLLLALVRMRNGQDFIQGRTGVEEKAAALDRLEAIAQQLQSPLLRADGLHERGVDLHVRHFHDDGNADLEQALFEEALELRSQHADVVGAAWSRFYWGAMQHVIRQDEAAAAEAYADAYARAEPLEDEPILMSYIVRHLGFVDQARGDLDAAHRRLEDSLRLRERAGWYAGTLAAHLALGSLQVDRGDPADARLHLDRARDIAEALDAHFLLRLVDEELMKLRD